MKKKIGLLVAAGAMCLVLTSAQATTITLTTLSTDIHAVGDVVPGVNYGDFGGNIGGDLAMANQLISMAINATFIGIGQNVGDKNVTYTRTANTFGFATPQTQMPSASGTIVDGGGRTVSQITLTGSGAYYLVAKYDGPNGGAEVWDISGLSTGDIINLPSTAWGHGMTGYALFGGEEASIPPQSIPDGGATVLLLGAALSGLGLLRRKLS